MSGEAFSVRAEVFSVRGETRFAWRWLYAGPDGALAPVVAFGGSKAAPPPPPPQPMPDLLDPALLAKKRNTLEAAAARSGRASTMLTDDLYSGDKLGLR